MFIPIKVNGAEFNINIDSIVTYRALLYKHKYVPVITVLPDKEYYIELTGQPYNTEQECIDELQKLLSGGN